MALVCITLALAPSGNMQVDGTIGQPAGGTRLTGGTLAQVGGFWQAIQGVPSALPIVQFSSSTYSVTKGDPNNPRVNIGVTRTGDTSGAASVGYSTIDDAGSQNCNVFNGIASPRCDYEFTVGTLQFAAGETSKSFSVAIIADSYAKGTLTFRVTLTNLSGATLASPSTANVTIFDNPRWMARTRSIRRTSSCASSISIFSVASLTRRALPAG